MNKKLAHLLAVIACLVCISCIPVSAASTKPDTPVFNRTYNYASGTGVFWKQVDNATGYFLYRSTNGASYKRVATIVGISKTSYLDKEARANGSQYNYLLFAFSKVNGKYYISSRSAIKTHYYLSYPTISNLTNTGAGKINVSWNHISPGTGYQVLYSTSSKFSPYKYVTVGGSSTLNKTISDLSPYVTHYFRVRAYRKVSGSYYFSPWSPIKQVKVAGYTPNAVTTRAATAMGARFVARWNASSSEVTGYQLAYSAASTMSNPAYRVTGKDTSMNVIINGNRKSVYYYQVRPYITINNKNYYGKWSDIRKVTMGSVTYLKSRLTIYNYINSSLNHGIKTAQYQKYIVLHDTEGGGTPKDVINGWLSDGNYVAAQFTIGRDGTIGQAVGINNIAHHAGYGNTGHNSYFGISEDGRDDMRGSVSIGSYCPDYAMNAWSIGIEMIHAGNQAYTTAQLTALDNLIAYIDAYYGFESTIIDHKQWRNGNTDTSSAFATYLANYKKYRTHSVPAL